MLQLLFTIIIGIIILSLVILIHELGHFFAAKICGIKVEEFGIGFPPRAAKLFRKNGTLYSLNWIPFGGFNKILGEEGGSKDPSAFCNKNVWARIFVASGGIIANILLAWILLTIWFWVINFVEIPNYIAIVSVSENSAAQLAGIKANDLIITINNQKVSTPEELSAITKSNIGNEITVTLKHDGKDITKNVTLSSDANAPLGISYTQTGGEKPNIKWYVAPVESVKEMYAVVAMTLEYLWQAVHSLFGGAKVDFQLSGPVGVVAFVAQTAAIGWFFLIRLAAIISLGLALFNIFPIPAVDGGRLVFLWLEAIFGKKLVKEQHENIIHGIGFIALILLSLIIVYFDIKRLL